MKKPTTKHYDMIRDHLRALPVNQRTQFIISLFQIAASEFSAMVLEHVKPKPPATRAYIKRQASSRRPSKTTPR